MIRVSIFEDNRHLRDTLEVLFNTAPGFTCAGAYADADDLVALLQACPCDVVLMDIEMPGINGVEATGLIRQYFPGMLTVIQTAFFDDSYIFNAIRAGAAGYILKTTSPAGYLEAVREVVAGGSPMTPGIARRVLELFRHQHPAPAQPSYNLTSREQTILAMLVEGRSYKMIAAELGVAIDTVKTHIRNLYSKLEVNSNTEAVSRALRQKLV